MPLSLSCGCVSDFTIKLYSKTQLNFTIGDRNSPLSFVQFWVIVLIINHLSPKALFIT